MLFLCLLIGLVRRSSSPFSFYYTSSHTWKIKNKIKITKLKEKLDYFVNLKRRDLDDHQKYLIFLFMNNLYINYMNKNNKKKE